MMSVKIPCLSGPELPLPPRRCLITYSLLVECPTPHSSIKHPVSLCFRLGGSFHPFILQNTANKRGSFGKQQAGPGISSGSFESIRTTMFNVYLLERINPFLFIRVFTRQAKREGSVPDKRKDSRIEAPNSLSGGIARIFFYH